MDNGRAEYIFKWFIENYSFCWHKNAEAVISPEFTFDGLEGTVWTIELYPRAHRENSVGNISVFLRRSKVDNNLEEFPLKCELALLAEDGSSLNSRCFEFAFKHGYGHGASELEKTDTVLSQRKAQYLPRDTLSVQCKIWRGEGSIQQVNEVAARTRIGIEQISFNHVTENFSSLEPNEKKTIEIKSPSRSKLVLSSSLYFIEDSRGGKIMMEITPSNTKHILTQWKLYLVDASGKKINCCEPDNLYDAIKKEIQILTLSPTRNIRLSLTRQAILKKNNEYLLHDKLSLIFECVLVTGVEYQKVERIQYGKSIVDVNQIINAVQNKDIYNAAEKLSACSTAIDDLKAMYHDELLTDVILKTKTKSFPAHKNWLSARSPVFKAMFTTVVRENNTNSIPIDDLEDDTVQEFLHFLYTDKLEDPDWDSAAKLYYVGDKYQIERLRVVCAAFLVDNVTTSSASELLLLADTHDDSELKKAVEYFILRHEAQVYGSEEWEQLARTNPNLVIKTMLLKYKSTEAISRNCQAPPRDSSSVSIN